MQLDQKWIDVICKTVDDQIKDSHKVLLFGSRSTGVSKKYSDIDVALVSDCSISLSQLLRISGSLEDSSLPYKVDVVDLARTEGRFRENILKDGVEL